MQTIKRIITVGAISAITTFAAVPGIAAADPNTGSGSKGTPTKKQVCEALPGIVNTLGTIAGAAGTGSAAQVIVQAAQQAIFDAGTKACPS